jgi:hypothetical protein
VVRLPKQPGKRLGVEVGPGEARGGARPIEVLQSARLLAAARQALLLAIIRYDEAQFRLFVALGQPPDLAAPGGGGPAGCPR